MLTITETEKVIETLKQIVERARRSGSAEVHDVLVAAMDDPVTQALLRDRETCEALVRSIAWDIVSAGAASQVDAEIRNRLRRAIDDEPVLHGGKLTPILADTPSAA